ncbi:MAG: PAS domain S-box protein [Bacteroidetes bacterium]|nr:PAS domain S-box protein [Bacteroidota bacterium]
MFRKIKDTVANFFSANQNFQLVKELSEKLKMANQKFDWLTRASNEAMRDCDLPSGTIIWNHGLQSLFGYPNNKEINYTTWLSLIHPAERDNVMGELTNIFASRQPMWSSIYRVKCASGSYRHIFDRVYVLYNENVPMRMIGTMQDIDERMMGLAEIDRLSMVASKTDNLVIITDPNQQIEWVNQGFVNRTGYSLKESLGKTPRMLQGAGTDQATLARIRKGISEQRAVTEEVLNYTSQGEKYWVKININPVLDEAQNLLRWVAVETDITRYKEYESKITAIARELSDLIANANAIIIGVDRNLYVNEWNAFASTATGYHKNDILGKKIATVLFHPMDQKKIESIFTKVLQGELFHQQELAYSHQDGHQHILLISATPRKNETGEIVGLIAVGHDITELTDYRNSLEERVKERTEELKIALKKEKELVEIKKQFVAIASHEFRTPLSTIHFAANFLSDHLEKLAYEDVRSKLKKIEKQVVHMTSLLDDVIVAGRTETNSIPVMKTVVSLRQFIDKLIEDVKNTTHTHEINLYYDVALQVIETDEKLVQSILTNMLTNAIKFSPQKLSIQLNVQQQEDKLTLEVIDQGIGISEYDQLRLFEPFHRGSNTHSIAGTGLGLSIIKKAAEALNGSVILKSQIDEGTTIKVILPISV